MNGVSILLDSSLKAVTACQSLKQTGTGGSYE